MPYPPLVVYQSEAEYRKHYIETYCRTPITTSDGYKVKFDRSRFDHAFYKSSQRNEVKDYFSEERAERIDWIKYSLESSSCDLRAGWDKVKKQYDFNYRISIMGNYIVVVSIIDRALKKARFITAYIADIRALVKITRSPKWK